MFLVVFRRVLHVSFTWLLHWIFIRPRLLKQQLPKAVAFDDQNDGLLVRQQSIDQERRLDQSVLIFQEPFWSKYPFTRPYQRSWAQRRSVCKGLRWGLQYVKLLPTCGVFCKYTPSLLRPMWTISVFLGYIRIVLNPIPWHDPFLQNI